MPDDPNNLRGAYLDLMKHVLTGALYAGEPLLRLRPLRINRKSPLHERVLHRIVNSRLGRQRLRLMETVENDTGFVEQGRDVHELAFTMIGLERLDNLQHCCERVIADRIPGDFIETGVWRGGACIFMRALLKAHGISDRVVWVADSFAGVPRPNPQLYPADSKDRLHTQQWLGVSIEKVRSNFQKFDLLDSQVRFLEGRFCDTLPNAPVDRLAILRLDGDMYESTIDGLVNLYPKLSNGGFVIIDDYHALKSCRQAVHDFRARHGVTEEIRQIGWTGAYWQRTR